MKYYFFVEVFGSDFFDEVEGFFPERFSFIAVNEISIVVFLIVEGVFDGLDVIFF